MEGRPRAVLVGKYKNIRNSYYGNIKYNTKVEYNTKNGFKNVQGFRTEPTTQ